ncbi:hypothetical protein MNEG_7879 [Monoraphidium neglectum]|uniref:Uncharacterized protein n=1 Tax=Monoraphidium neglectum TaxID=145388 RepID=A0A0D2MHC2_9CHLO|nr:hypothetical protein MNEG_7879 [Monoraphidium neglectum]KIZ00082.1 hypothetical protein MNEG_7879 [Monoraphidium neglectum]|eukprot:XP_013899101.1 hypothetical protein MNEG_7879 [Monoraphidium neglectum]
MASEDAPAPPAERAPPPSPPPLSLDECREAFYVAQRATERYAAQLKAFVDVIDSKKAQAGEAWIEAVQDEARKATFFHTNQLAEWEDFAERADSYVDSVRRLAERLAIAELKGETLEEADLPENKARTVHPELLKFKLEKRSRILGKIGGVPALGPGTVIPKLPTGGPGLRATASSAAREINYSKVEGKDARYLADVFQFKTGGKKKDDGEPTEWQQEASTILKRKAQVEKSEEALRAELKSPFGEELTGVLQQRHTTLKAKEDEAAAVAASAYRRSSARDEAPPDATPELAAKLKRRQQEEERAIKEAARKAREDAEAAENNTHRLPAGRHLALQKGVPTPAWQSTAPFGSELASALQKRNQAKADAIRNAVAKEEGRASGSAGVPDAESEWARRLRRIQGGRNDE